MDRWVGKVAVVTGASAGVGAAITVQLIQKGLTVVAVARRVEKIQQLQSQLSGAPGKLVPMKGDVSSEEEIKKIFAFVKDSFKTVHVLVNNAGYGKYGTFIDGEPSDWKKILDVNVLGLAICAKEAVKLMRDAGVDDGQIININSVAGHLVPPTGSHNIYPPSKYAVTAISETLRNELRGINSKIRCTNLSPGTIKTEFFEVYLRGEADGKEEWLKSRVGRAALNPEDLAEAVIYILSAPPHVQINELLMTPI